MISSSTDDGTPIRCDFCGSTTLVNVSRPPGDSVCPTCGVLLWVNAIAEVTQQTSLNPTVTLPTIAARTRDAAIAEIVDVSAMELGWTQSQRESLIAAIIHRECLGSTGIGRGFAVPHASMDWITDCVTAVAHSPHAIDYESLDGRAVHTIIMIASPASNRGDHLRTIERISRCIRSMPTQTGG